MGEQNITAKISKLKKDIEKLYLSDSRPWIIGLSGGKDSTCVTQLIYYMLLDLPPKKRTKKVHIVSADTLVESPLIERRIKDLLSKIESAAEKDDLPLFVNLLKPSIDDTFWVNLIGKGYPSPNRWFRWCTDRLKIKPTTKYIKSQVKENGEVIVILGARKSESASRAQTMGKYEIKNFNLRKHGNISGAFVYTPIEDFTTKNVWTYLLQVPSPWKGDNRELIRFYRKADKECPLVLDKKTPACGGSRFGCWTCTVVKRDRALEGLIEDGEEWLKPLLDFRNWLKEIRNNPDMREKYRKNERQKKIIANKLKKKFEKETHRGHEVLGPFTFEARHQILERLLRIQKQISELHNIELIQPEELKAIERIWLYEGDNISSLSDVIDTSSEKFLNNVDKSPLESNQINKEILKRISEKNSVPITLIEKLLIVEKDLSTLSNRKGIYNKLERAIGEHLIQSYLEE